MNQTSATSRFAPTTWSKDRVRHVRLLALSLLAVAIVAALPAIGYLLDSIPASESIQQHRWVYLMLLIMVIQLGLAVILVLYVDWSTLWAVTITNLLFVGGVCGAVCNTGLSRVDERDHFILAVGFRRNSIG